MRDAKRQMRSVYHSLSDWIAGDPERGSRSSTRSAEGGTGGTERRDGSEVGTRAHQWGNSDAPFLQAMEPNEIRKRKMATIERGVGAPAPRLLSYGKEDKRALRQLRKSDRAYLADMSAESKREADAEERGEK